MSYHVGGSFGYDDESTSTRDAAKNVVLTRDRVCWLCGCKESGVLEVAHIVGAVAPAGFVCSCLFLTSSSGRD